MTTEALEWQDTLPGLPITGGKRMRFVAALKERPGVWARYPHSLQPNTAYASRYINRDTFPGTEWAVREVDGETVLYGRWVGDDILPEPVPKYNKQALLYGLATPPRN